MDNSIPIALIGAGGQVFSVLVAGAAAALIGKRFLNQQRLKAKLREARTDAFLLKVERGHCIRSREPLGKPYFKMVREEVSEIGVYSWSEKHAPRRVKSASE